MRPLVLFSYGMTKCGTTLAYHLAHVGLEMAGAPQFRLPGRITGLERTYNAIEHLDRDQGAALWDLVARAGYPLALKTHTRPDPVVAEMLGDGRAVAHAIYRDPRDMALSMLDHGVRARAKGRPAFAEIVTLDDALAAIRNQVRSLAAWLRLPNVLPLAYDDIAFDTEATAARIFAQLGIAPDPAAVVAHVRANRFTQFNKGRPHRHRDEMAPDDAARIAAEFAPLIERLIAGRARLPGPGQPVLGPSDRLTNPIAA